MLIVSRRAGGATGRRRPASQRQEDRAYLAGDVIIAGTDKPDYGALLDEMFFGDGSEIEMDRFIAPFVEVEIGFTLARDLRGPGCSLDEVFAATAFVLPMHGDSRFPFASAG